MADKAPATPAAPARGKKMIVILLVVAVCSAGGGFVLPRFLHSQPSEGGKGKQPAPKDVYISVGEVMVNLSEGRMNRFLRVKVVLVTNATQEKQVNERIEARKASLRNWLIAHLSDKALSDVQGRASINRIRREILEQYSATLFPEGGNAIQDVLFEEFSVH